MTPSLKRVFRLNEIANTIGVQELVRSEAPHEVKCLVILRGFQETVPEQFDSAYGEIDVPNPDVAQRVIIGLANVLVTGQGHPAPKDRNELISYTHAVAEFNQDHEDVDQNQHAEALSWWVEELLEFGANMFNSAARLGSAAEMVAETFDDEGWAAMNEPLDGNWPKWGKGKKISKSGESEIWGCGGYIVELGKEIRVHVASDVADDPQAGNAVRVAADQILGEAVAGESMVSRTVKLLRHLYGDRPFSLRQATDVALKAKQAISGQSAKVHQTFVLQSLERYVELVSGEEFDDDSTYRLLPDAESRLRRPR